MVNIHRLLRVEDAGIHWFQCVGRVVRFIGEKIGEQAGRQVVVVDETRINRLPKLAWVCDT